MRHLKSLRFVFIVLLIILVFVIARTSNRNLFKQNSKSVIEAAKEGNNTISLTDLENLTTSYLVVNLSDSSIPNTIQSQNSTNIPFENLLDKSNQKTLKNTHGKILLYSKDISTTSKAWVILNQLGFKNIFILQPEEDSEVLKYKFQPDSSAKLE